MNTATLTREEARTDLYPSRGGLKGNIVPRNHPVVWSPADVQPPVERGLIDQYERDGFLVLRDVFSPEEVANLQAELDRLRHEAESLQRPEVITEKSSRQVRSIFKVHELSTVFARLAADQRLAGLASYLLGDQVYLHQSRMNYKPGFHGKEFYWHSDFETWHIEDGMPLPRALSISVSLTDNTPHNGPLLVMPGSHKHYVVCEGETPPDNYQMSLKAQETGVPSDENLARLAEMGGLVDTAGPAGSVLIFDSNLMHGSNSNITHLPRSNAFFVYNALSNAVEAPFCNQAPQPEFIATRERFSPLQIRENSAATSFLHKQVSNMQHTIEKIGGTSMSDYAAVRDNIVLHGGADKNLYGRVFVVSAYGGITDMLLEHKRSGDPGVYALFAGEADDEGNADHWEAQLDSVLSAMLAHNDKLFGQGIDRREADLFITERIEGVRSCLQDLRRVCTYGHFQLDEHLTTLRELLASLGEVHSAYNMAALLRREGVAARFVDLTGWRETSVVPLDERLKQAFDEMDLERELPVVTGYCQCTEGMVRTFDRGYSEMTFARLAVVSGAREAIIHKEFHLSSADPRMVGTEKVIPIGRTNYDVADQLANLGMEAIHPRAAKGLRQLGIPLRVKNTFEPEHAGTLFTHEYVSAQPKVEIIAGRKGVMAIEVFDQDMVGANRYDSVIVGAVHRHRARIITKDLNANTITHFLDTGLGAVKRIIADLEKEFPNAEIQARKVAIVSAVGSDLKISGMLSRTVSSLAKAGVDILAVHQSMRQVDIQFVIDEKDYEKAVISLHAGMVETGSRRPVEIAA